ncbi:MAG: RNA polymerase sigma factor (TIGR02999 family) [Paraglaciecola sp.]|jgi:RNA polymerase sigma factor (TIGR02999 family)
MNYDFIGLLGRIKIGDKDALNTITEIAYLKIKEISSAERDKGLKGANTSYITTSRTDIAHEVYCELLDSNKLKDLTTEREFYGLIKSAVRLHLVTHQRKINALKRNPYDKISIHGEEAQTMTVNDSDFIDIITLDQALKSLSEESSEHVDVIELRFFMQLSDKEIARILGISVRTVQSKLSYARAWLSDFVA